MLARVARGLPNRPIAEELGITERTARTHVSNILAKLGLASRTQAALLAVQHGLDREDVTAEARAYDVAGPATAPAIVFVHGTRSDPLVVDTPAGGPARLLPGRRDGPARSRGAGRPTVLAGRGRRGWRGSSSTAGGGAIVVGLSLGGYVGWTSPLLVRTSSAGWSSRARPQEPVGRSPTPYLALAWVMDRLDGRPLDAPQCVVLPDPLSAGHRRADRRRGLLRPAARRPCAPSSASASRRGWPPTQARRSSSTASSTCCSGWVPTASRGTPGMCAGSASGCHPPCQPGPPGGVQSRRPALRRVASRARSSDWPTRADRP